MHCVTSFNIRPMCMTDLPAVLAVQTLSFDSALTESDTNFRARFTRFGEYFLVAELDGSIVGYALCFPWHAGAVPEHNQPFSADLPAPDRFYLHDLSIHPRCRGKGLSQTMLTAIYGTAQRAGFTEVALVAVAQSGHYWDKQGFEADTSCDATLRACVEANYGHGARLMTRDITA